MKVLMVEISQFVVAIYSSINTKKKATKNEDTFIKMAGFSVKSDQSVIRYRFRFCFC